MRTDRLVELEAFFPDIEPELPRCPTPVIENKIRDAIIDACERASIWRWEHPEILVIEGQQDYDLLTPTSDTLIHSILSLELNGRPIDGCNDVDMHEDYMVARRGFSVADRGQISLTAKPNRSSSPYRSATAPTVPTVPVDPGPLNTGLGGFTEYTPILVTPTVTNGNLSSNVPLPAFLSGPGVALLLDLTGLDVSSITNNFAGANTGVGFGPNPGTGPNYQINKNFNYEANTEGGNATVDNNFLFRQDIEDAQADGRNFLLLRWVGGSASVMLSGISTLEDVPKLLQQTRTYAQMEAIAPSTFGTQNLVRVGSTDEMITNGASDASELIVQGLSPGEFFSLGVANVTNNESNVSHWTHKNGLRYDFDFGNRLGISEYNVASLVRVQAGFRELSMAIVKQAAPGDPGIILIGQDTSPGQEYAFVQRPTALDGGDEVTQADIDQYLADLAAYNAAVSALAQWESYVRTYIGLEPLVSIKPSRTTLEVSEVLVRDYYQLIVTGTLSKALMMLNRPWSNPEMGKEMEKQYEYALAKAKQGVDRGFVTGSQRIKPRRFVG